MNESLLPRAEANHFKETVTSNEHRAFIARRTGISRYIRFNEREGAQSSSVLAKAVNAVISVIFFDCGKDIGIVLKTMRHLGLVHKNPVRGSMLTSVQHILHCRPNGKSRTAFSRRSSRFT